MATARYTITIGMKKEEYEDKVEPLSKKGIKPLTIFRAGVEALSK